MGLLTPPPRSPFLPPPQPAAINRRQSMLRPSAGPSRAVAAWQLASSGSAKSSGGSSPDRQLCPGAGKVRRPPPGGG